MTPNIKVCGLTCTADALACADLGVNWLGLNFHPGSPRKVDPAIAAEIVATLPATCAAVGLFVGRPPSEVRAIAGSVGIPILQLHGDEPPEDLVALADFTLVRAFRIGDVAAIDRLNDYLERCRTLGREPDHVLVDGYLPGQAGGTGQSIGLTLLDQLPTIPGLILAGGLTPENVADRVVRVRPWMVDVASGVESSPGRKDPARVRAFVAAVRSTAEKRAVPNESTSP